MITTMKIEETTIRTISNNKCNDHEDDDNEGNDNANDTDDDNTDKDKIVSFSMKRKIKSGNILK